MLSHVVELVDHHRAELLARLGDAPEARDHVVGGVSEVASRENGVFVGGDRLDDDHGRPTHGPLPVIREVLVGGQPQLAHVGRVRPEVDPMFERDMPQIQRLEDVRKRVGHGGIVALQSSQLSACSSQPETLFTDNRSVSWPVWQQAAGCWLQAADRSSSREAAKLRGRPRWRGPFANGLQQFSASRLCGLVAPRLAGFAAF